MTKQFIYLIQLQIQFRLSNQFLHNNRIDYCVRSRTENVGCSCLYFRHRIYYFTNVYQ